MSRKASYGHAVRIFLIIGVALVVALVVRSQLVPPSFGELGHYRADAVAEARALPSRHVGDETCDMCHDDIVALHVKDAHAMVSCEACHGPGHAHVDAEGEGGIVRPEGQQACLVCHELMPARPGEFAQIVRDEHYDFVGVAGTQTDCTACHDPHEPLYMDRDLRTARLHPLIHRCRDCHTGRTDETMARPADHPAIFECDYCHASVVSGFEERPHAAMRCTACHIFIRESEFAGRIVRDADPRFCLLCHRDADFRSDDAAPSVTWPEHREMMAMDDADLEKRCVDCHQDRIHPLGE